jgi:putative tricarboxylic transport membrane protein
MRKAFIISQGSLGIFFEKPISLVFMLILLVILLFPAGRLVLTKLGVLKGKKN